MMEWTIRIPGPPYAQKRHKSRAANIGGKYVARAYDPAENRSWKALAQQQLANDGPHTSQIWLPDGAVELDILAVFALPKGRWRKRQPICTRARHIQRPDGDNIAKAVKDACSGIVFRDDCQVSDERVMKRFGAQGEAPFVEITIRAVAYEATA